MANNLSAIMPKILASGLSTLRENAIMPRLVNGDYGRDAAMKGSTVDVPVPTALVAGDVTASNVFAATSDVTSGTVQVPLNNWKKAAFKLSDKDMMDIERTQSFVPMQVAEAARALANQVNQDILNEYVGVYGFHGTPGTTPFGSTPKEGDVINVRKILSEQVCPPQSRRFVLDFAAEAAALGLASFQDYDKAADSGPKIEGALGRKFGFDFYADHGVLTHAAGSLTGTITTDSGGHSVGDTAVTLDTGSGEAVALKAGDIITFADDAQTYAVQADVNVSASSSGAVTISPPLKVAQAGAKAVTVKASHVVNLAFHRDAFAFANRPLAAGTQDMALGSQIQTISDPETGLSMRLEVRREYKQVVWEFDMLYGVKLVRPELACRLAG